jgi:hypothetical protein
VNEQDPQTRIAARLREIRSSLDDQVAAIDRLDGFAGPDGIAFTLQAGVRLRRDHPIVRAYPDRFRPLTPAEMERALKGERRQLELTAGL